MAETSKQSIRSIDQGRKDHIVNLMRAVPVSFPYVDFTAIRKVTPLIARYNASMNVLTEEDLLEIGLEADHLPDLLLCRWVAAKYVAEAIKEKGSSYVDAALICQVDKTRFTRFKRGDRPIDLEAEAFVPLCRNVLHESCNKVMFGEPGKVLLPGVYSEILKEFTTLAEEDQKSIVEASDEARKRFELMNPTVAGTGLHRHPDDLIRERLWQLAYASGRNVENFFGEKQARRIRNNIKSYFENNPLYRPKMSFTVFLAFETGYALDYFIAEDFASYVPCFYKDGDTEVEITNRLAIRFISNIFAVDEATSIKMTTPVISKYLKQS